MARWLCLLFSRCCDIFSADLCILIMPKTSSSHGVDATRMQTELMQRIVSHLEEFETLSAQLLLHYVQKLFCH